MHARSGWVLALLALLEAMLMGAPAAAPVAQHPATPASAPARAPGGGTTSEWNKLTSSQKLALKPLAGTWNRLTEGQKRKWLALSRNFGSMSESEQTTLHSRMTEWAALSAKQRSEARLNFAETRRLPADEKKAKWEAYQALSAEEKRKLAARTPSRRSAALAIKPGPANDLVQAPTPKVLPRDERPGTLVPLQQLQPNTLLPRRSASQTAPTFRQP